MFRDSGPHPAARLTRTPNSVLTLTSRPRTIGIGLAAIVLAAVGCSPAATPAPAVSAPPTLAPSVGPSASAAASAGASAASAAPASRLGVTAREYAFDTPATTPAGPTTIALSNQGKEEHQAQLVKLPDGTAITALVQALQNPDPSVVLKLVTLAGGPTSVAPGATVSTTSNLAPGQYAFLCFVPSPDGIPHVAKGMLAPLQVTGSASTAALPAGEATVTAKDFSYDVAAGSLKAGKHTLTFVNNGPSPHEAALVKLPQGMTVDTLKQILSATPAPSASPAPAGPPPWTSAGGTSGTSPGTTTTFDIDVTAGNYAFLCFIPDPASRRSHMELGMISGLTVQ